MPCSACHDDDLLYTPDLDMPKCGVESLETISNYEEQEYSGGHFREGEDVYENFGCADTTLGSCQCFGYDKVCMSGCPGGQVMPIAKKWFFVVIIYF